MDHFNFFGLVSEDMAGEWEIVGSMDERSRIGGAWVEMTEEGMKLSVVPCPAVFRVIYSKNKFNISQSETESQMCKNAFTSSSSSSSTISWLYLFCPEGMNGAANGENLDFEAVLTVVPVLARFPR